jgi:hypothetical protein
MMETKKAKSKSDKIKDGFVHFANFNVDFFVQICINISIAAFIVCTKPAMTVVSLVVDC